MDLIGRLLTSFAAIEAAHYARGGCEIWLNPADFEALGSPVAPTTLFGLPVRASIGVPRDEVYVFDHLRMEYLRAKPGVDAAKEASR
jgi:hypothetical protein